MKVNVQHPKKGGPKIEGPLDQYRSDNPSRSILMKLASSPEQNSVDTQQAQLSMGRLKRLAAQRYVTPYELSRNILQEAGYEITRREEKTPLGHRGYDVLFPCSIEGQQHQKRMRRSWLIKLAELVMEGFKPEEIAINYFKGEFDS